jgi:hypothetical protein
MNNAINEDPKLAREFREEKSKFEKKLKKKANPVRKVIMNAIKAAVIPMVILLAKILAVVILVTVLISAFVNLLDGNSSGDSISNNEEYNSTISNGGGIDLTNTEWNFTKDEIQKFIENYNSSNSALKNDMINNIDKIIKWQNDYGYSSAFLITIAFEENRNDFETFLDEMQQKAETWKNNEYKTTKEIAKDYVGDDTANEWANNIENKMQEVALNSDIIKYGETSISGDGYPNLYVSKAGRTYRNYKQNIGSYSLSQWCGTSIVKKDGCSLIAVTIIVSGYRNSEVNPLELAQKYAVKGAGMSISGALLGEGISFTEPLGADITFSEQQKETIKNHVKGSGPAIIKVVPPSQFTNSTHFMALLDYNASTNEFYLSNPYTGNNSYGVSGWIDADRVLIGCTRFYAIK